jgi:hypothetical protein
MVARLNGLFGGALGGESFTLSQSYYYGTARRIKNGDGSIMEGTPVRVEIVEGDFIDLRGDLADDSTHLADAAKKRPFGDYADHQRAGPLDVDKLLAGMTKGVDVNITLTRICASLTTRGWDDDAIVERVLPESKRVWGDHWDKGDEGEEKTIRKMCASARKKFPTQESFGPVNAPAYSEEALALRFAERHGATTRYVAEVGKWLSYDGARWNFDKTREPFSHARNLCREAANELNKPRERKAIASAKTRAAVISLATDDRRMAATLEQWDADPWLLNTPGGVVDLRTGEMLPHAADDYMTKITAVHPDPSCPTPLWNAFLDKVTSGNADYQAFLARVCGYGLTGSTRDHAMFFLHGDGRNGKGTFVGTVAGIMGDYHRTAPTEAFMETKNDRHSTELAMLRGARLVTATETEENRRWAEATIKKLTGGDLITARFMRQDFFEYRTSSASLLASSSSAPNASRSANRDRSRRSTPRSRSRSPAPRPRGGQRRAAQT